MQDKDIRYYLTDSTAKEIKVGGARWLMRNSWIVNTYCYDLKDALSWLSLEDLKKDINLNKDCFYDLKPAKFVDGKFVRLIQDKKLKLSELKNNPFSL